MRGSSMSAFPYMFTIILLLSTAATMVFSNGIGSCRDNERDALLMFKADMTDEFNRLASWTALTDCCSWSGVICNNVSGHVTQLRLRNPNPFRPWPMPTLQASKLNPSLLELKHLNYLDLSGNDFEQIPIPSFIGSIQSLRYLNLSSSAFRGMIPPEIGNLTHLKFLDLGNNYFGSIYSNNLNWVTSLSLLQTLDLSDVNLENVSDWMQQINKLVFLVQLQLQYCKLVSPITHPAVATANFSSLAVLDLSRNNLDSTLFQTGLQNLTCLKELHLDYNKFNSSIPNWLYSFGRLEFLDLGGNEMHGDISNEIENLTSLMSLDLSRNNFQVDGNSLIRSIGNLCNLRWIDLAAINLTVDVTDVFGILAVCISNQLEFLALDGCYLYGQLPNHGLGQFRNLASLYLSSNSISGNIPISFGSLSTLELADLSDNLMQGVVTEQHFANLKRLTFFLAGSNSLTLQVSPNWIPPFQLDVLYLTSWHLGQVVPLWIRTQKNLDTLDMSCSSLVTIPSWFWNISSQFSYLNLSRNHLHGKIRQLMYSSFAIIDLSSNNLEGTLPIMPSEIAILDLSKNSFSGSISRFLCSQVDRNMQYLNLESNRLSGEIPNCWIKWQALEVLHLSNNGFTGKIPSSMGNLIELHSLHLRGNNLSGGIPISLKNCKRLTAIDFGENQLVGKIPNWIGEVSELKIINLRSNKFHGPIPHETCYLRYLQILDLSHNNLSGFIPKCIGNFSAMISTNGSVELYSIGFILSVGKNGINHDELENAQLVVKGLVLEYTSNLKWVRSIDLSSNFLSGDIPMEVTRLVQLQTLNFSNNLLMGKIHESIGDMKQLESLDLSRNKLSGQIPQTLSALTFLSHLNLSYNKLVGKIPSSTQIAGFDGSCFVGNELCGLPLNKTCSAIEAPEGEGNEGEEHIDTGKTLYWSTIAYGFAVGFWCVVGPIMFSRKWRIAYFNFLDRIMQKFKMCVC